MKGTHEPRSSSSCAACKLLKRRCVPTCIFAPHFRSDEPSKFAKVHKVFGASNVSKILSEVPEEQREDTVSSLAYEAEARLRDPVYGCIGAIAMLQGKMVELQHDLAIARARLACYGHPSSSSVSSSSSASSYTMLEDHLTEANFAGLPAFSGFNNAFSQSSTEFMSQHGTNSGFSYPPYIL
ncbi:putative transcription factor AS2-LOB family [Rosa chinensis]|uniref:Putative transcription factor AS2-LOB family n=1 Tax=Rosa chinensis TaxID=74649 RepID=A0A2P6SLD7_ROSCH|nr:LOB domain-containing protein 21 [Rosa chinensis]PRQ59483.1 putative transcription factor AS2-LOB family [Rosa chinensis]